MTASVLPAIAQSDQQRSSTGRHRPPPPPKREPARQATATGGHAQTGWFVGLGAGVTSGGDLWRVETVNDVPVAWQSAVPFSSPRFNATLTSNAGVGLMVGRQLGEVASVRLDFHSARMDVMAEAPQGQTAGVFGYDRLTMTMVTVSGELKLARIASAPYLNAGLILNSLSAARESELDQTQLGLRVGLGYFRALTPGMGLRVEARYSRTGFDTNGFVPQTASPPQPEVDFQPAGDLDLFEVVLAAQLNL